MTVRKPILILGAGGHAKVLIDALRSSSGVILGIVDPSSSVREVLGIPVIGDDSVVEKYAPGEIELVNALGSVCSTKARRALFEKFARAGYKFASVIHPSAVIAADVCLGEGVQVMAGAVIQTGSTIGDNTILNTRACVDHDCEIGAHVHVAPGVTLSGGVRVHDNAHIGCGAVVIQGVEVGASSLVGAGSVVIHAVPPNIRVAGVPARTLNNE